MGHPSRGSGAGTVRNPCHLSARVHASQGCKTAAPSPHAHLSLIVPQRVGRRLPAKELRGHPLWRKKVWRLVTPVQQDLGRSPGPEPRFGCFEFRGGPASRPSPVARFRRPGVGIGCAALRPECAAARGGLTASAPGPGEDGGGAGGGDPHRPREEPARASRVPLAGAEGFPSYRRLTFAPSAEHEGLAPPAAGSPGSGAQALWPPQWVGPRASPAVERRLARGSGGCSAAARRRRLLCSSWSSPPAKHRHKAKAGHRCANPEHLLGRWSPDCGRGWERGLARAESPRSLQPGWEIINNENPGWVSTPGPVLELCWGQV